MARDPAHEAADEAVEAFRAEVADTYRKAEASARGRLDAYLSRFADEDAAKAAEVRAGTLSDADYRSWRRSRMLAGRRYGALLDQMAAGYTGANQDAAANLAGRLPDVAAENANYGAYQVESASGVDTLYAMQDASTIQVMLADHGAYLPSPTVRAAKDAAWNRRMLASQLTQGVMLGESIPRISRRLARVTGSNVATATRMARTCVTAAENAGRVSSYQRAKSMGIDLRQEWLATLDGRTRHSHRELDGERVGVGETFSNGCRYPGDPQAPYAETCNCRCTLVAAVDGVDQSDGRRWSRLPDHMTYEEWRAGRPQASNPANRTMAEFFEMPGTRRKLDAAGVSKTEARRLLTRQLEDLNVSSGSFRKLPAGDQQRALDMALARRKPTHGEMRRAGVKPINEALYSSQKNYVERHGGCVVRGGKDVTRMLDQRGADAIFYAGDRTILLREQPTTSEVLEEVYHFRQDLRGDYADLPQDEMVTRREIDAQNYLLGVTERYRIPDSEVEQTKRNLAGYEADLRKMEARRHEGD